MSRYNRIRVSRGVYEYWNNQDWKSGDLQFSQWPVLARLGVLVAIFHEKEPKMKLVNQEVIVAGSDSVVKIIEQCEPLIKHFCKEVDETRTSDMVSSLASQGMEIMQKIYDENNEDEGYNEKTFLKLLHENKFFSK